MASDLYKNDKGAELRPDVPGSHHQAFPSPDTDQFDLLASYGERRDVAAGVLSE